MLKSLPEVDSVARDADEELLRPGEAPLRVGEWPRNKRVSGARPSKSPRNPSFRPVLAQNPPKVQQSYGKPIGISKR